MSPRRVSIVVWFDAKTDPPKGDMARTVLALYGRYPVAVRAYAVTAKSGVWWAELPVVSDLTDDDVRKVMFAVGPDCVLNEYSTSSDVEHYDRFIAASRAALGGEKEET